MKFGDNLRYFATWLGMSAAGSWMLPVLTLAAAPREAVAVALPTANGPGDDGWTGSEVANAWALATGSEYAPTDEVLAMESGADQSPVLVDRISSDDGSSLGLSWFMVNLSLPIAETSDQGAEVSITAHAELVTGRVVGALGHPGHFSAIRIAMIGAAPSMAGVSERFALLPFAAFQTEADAVAFHEEMVEASEGSGEDAGGGGGLVCVNPNWRGFNGVECCMFESAYQNGLKACRAAYWARFVACIIGALAITTGTWKLCIEGCAYPCMAGPQACALCAKGCFILGGLVGVGAVVACEFQNQKWYEECILDKLAQYQINLATNGCPPKPGTQSATAEKSGILDAAETLDAEAD